MKKYLVQATITAVMASAPLIALAEDAVTSPTPKPSTTVRPKAETAKERAQALKEQAQKKKEEMEKKRAEEKEKNEKRKEEVRRFWGNMVHRLEILIRNELRLAEQIGKRLDGAAASGKDITEAKAQLQKARDIIKEAQELLRTDAAKVKALVEAKDAKEALRQVKAMNEEVLAKIKEAHRLLVSIGGLVKGSSTGERKPSPSPSPSPTTSPSPSPTTQ